MEGMSPIGHSPVGALGARKYISVWERCKPQLCKPIIVRSMVFNSCDVERARNRCEACPPHTSELSHGLSLLAAVGFSWVLQDSRPRLSGQVCRIPPRGFADSILACCPGLPHVALGFGTRCSSPFAPADAWRASSVIFRSQTFLSRVCRLSSLFNDWA